MTFEDYVNIDSNVQTDEKLAELQSEPIPDLEEEKEEAAEASAIEPSVYYLADYSYNSMFFSK